MKRLFLIALMAVSLVVAGQSTVFAVDLDNNIGSPYWRADSAKYTFLAIGNASIASNTPSSRQVTITALKEDGTSGGTMSFYIPIGQVKRAFVIQSGQNTSLKANFPNQVIEVSGTGDGGSLVISDDTGVADSGNITAWGAIFFPTTKSGFAMSFGGDSLSSGVY